MSASSGQHASWQPPPGLEAYQAPPPKSLKSALWVKLALDINNEVVDQNRLLDGMSGDMNSAASMMNGTLEKMGKLLNSPDGKHMM